MVLSAPEFHSVDPGDGEAVLHFTPVDEAGYDHVQVRYKKRGESDWVQGLTAAGTPGVASQVTQDDLDNATLYDFDLLPIDDGGAPGWPSARTLAAWITDGAETAEEKNYIDNLKTLLANCAALHTWMGLNGTFEENVAAALARIHDTYKTEGDITKPFLFVDAPEDFRHNAISGGSSNVWLSSATLQVRFVAAPPNAASGVRAAVRGFMASVGAIVAQAKRLAGTDNFLYVRGIDMVMRPDIWGPDENDEEILAAYNFTCGLGE